MGKWGRVDPIFGRAFLLVNTGSRMSDKENGDLSQKDLDNYQRILAGNSSSTLTIMGFTLTFLVTGFGGIFAISTTQSEIQKPWWHLWLSLLMLIIMLILFVVWLREHALGAQAIRDLNGKVRFPETGCWKGVTSRMWKTVYVFSILFWAAFSGYSLNNIVALMRVKLLANQSSDCVKSLLESR
jgi:cytochrome c biogenesis protein CcdA